MKSEKGYCVVLTLVAPYKASRDIVLTPRIGDVAELQAAIAQPAFDALIATPTEIGGKTAILDAQALQERLAEREARDHVSQIDDFETRRAMKRMIDWIGDDGREILLARYERAPRNGYQTAEEAPAALTPTPFKGI